MADGPSVQLYTVREALTDDLPATLDRLAGMGFRQVEPFGLSTHGAALAAALPAAGLTAPTAHQSFVGRDDADAVFATAAELGVRTVIDPMVARERWTTPDGVRSVADDLAAAAERAAAHGVAVGYHNHAQELEIHHDGTTALEVLAAELDERVVLEVDVYWAAVGGQDPVALLGRLGGRVAALHLKDGPVTTDTRDQVAVGRGTLPIEAIVGAAPHALRVVELDDTRGDRFTAVADSLEWLRGAGLA
ncbi:sugar phosphate isomerase/epimerase family protein [Pseudonocardia lacus]|uniref:sugar phosphate isomerase/epimerase family protein n=1 Tax=Pseudonocardia lacus TaxID=2835865 RepID=UPI0027E2FB17|nr:sugar phosphate isomerase/epimerase [Pseudonocardia lacus]